MQIMLVTHAQTLVDELEVLSGNVTVQLALQDAETRIGEVVFEWPSAQMPYNSSSRLRN